MSGYVGDLTAAQEDTLRWMQRTLREEADKPGFLETVPSNYFDEVADDSLVLRFCRARKWNREKALEMFLNAIKWRQSFGVLELKESDLDMSILNAGIFYFVRDGYDKSGRPIAIIHVRNHDKNLIDPINLKKFTIYQMETARRLLPPGQETVLIVFDMADFGLKNMDLDFVKFLIAALERYYPESLGRLCIYTAPWIFNSFWRIVRPLLDEVVASKIQFVNQGGLDEYIDKDVLPRILGGNGTDAVHPIIPSQYYKEMAGVLDMSPIPADKRPPPHVSSREAAAAALAQAPLLASPSASSSRLLSDGSEAEISAFDLVDIEPATVLLRKSSVSAPTATGAMTVRNRGGLPLNYKIKTTAPKLIFVQPNMGRVAPGETATLTVELQIGTADEPRGSEKLLCQCLVVEDAAETALSVAEFWARADKDASRHRIERKLRCKLVVDPQAEGARGESEAAARTAALARSLPVLSAPTSSPVKRTSSPAVSSPVATSASVPLKPSTATVRKATAPPQQPPLASVTAAPTAATQALDSQALARVLNELADLNKEVRHLRSVVAAGEPSSLASSKAASNKRALLHLATMLLVAILAFAAGLSLAS